MSLGNARRRFGAITEETTNCKDADLAPLFARLLTAWGTGHGLAPCRRFGAGCADDRRDRPWQRSGRQIRRRLIGCDLPLTPKAAPCRRAAPSVKQSHIQSPYAAGTPPGRQSLKILIVDESPIRAAILEEGLREAGFKDVERIGGDA